MSCRGWEKDLALAVEGDLSERRFGKVERHLAACAACREFADRLEESQGVVQSLRDEPVDTAALDAVRARVLERVRERPVAPNSWRWAFAFPALAAAAAAAFWIWAPPEVAPPPVPRSPAVVAELPRPAQPAPVVKTHRRTPPRSQIRRPEPPAEPLLVRLETADPNVVIYWTFDPKGD